MGRRTEAILITPGPQVPAEPVCDVYQQNERRDFDERTYYPDERFPRIETEHSDRYSNRQLEVVPGSSERERG